MIQSVLPSLVGHCVEHLETGERRLIEDVLLVPGTGRVAYATVPADEPRLEVWDELEAEVIREEP
jgi:hypothetical protein